MTKIAVLDDDRNIVSLLKEVLEEEGYRVDTFYHPMDFLEYIKKEKPNVLIVDLQLPDMNGIEVVEELRRLRPHCKVIMITGYPSIQSTIGALRQGVSDYLIKPFTIDSIKKTIQKVLSSAEKPYLSLEFTEKKTSSFLPARIYIDNRTSLYVIETNIDYLYRNKKMDEITYNLLKNHINRLKGKEACGEFDLKNVCDEVFFSFKSVIEENNIIIKQDIPQNIILYGKCFFEIAFRELLINAIEHVISLDDKQIKVYLKRDDDNLYLIVENSGSLKNEVKKRMFECFYTTKQFHLGIGLNLALYYLNRINMSVKVINNCKGVCIGILIEKGG